MKAFLDTSVLVATFYGDHEHHAASNSAQGVAGGGIYDVLLASCALKAGADAIYTWNVKHFKRLGPGIAGRVQSP